MYQSVPIGMLCIFSGPRDLNHTRVQQNGAKKRKKKILKIPQSCVSNMFPALFFNSYFFMMRTRLCFIESYFFHSPLHFWGFNIFFTSSQQILFEREERRSSSTQRNCIIKNTVLSCSVFCVTVNSSCVVYFSTRSSLHKKRRELDLHFNRDEENYHLLSCHRQRAQLPYCFNCCHCHFSSSLMCDFSPCVELSLVLSHLILFFSVCIFRLECNRGKKKFLTIIFITWKDEEA